MNPLSAFTYYRRHLRQAALLAALVCLTTTGLYVMAAVLDSIPTRARVNYLTRVARVYPAAGGAIDPGALRQIAENPDVERVIPDNGLPISPPALIGYDSFRLLGVSPEDAAYLMARFGVRLKEGRMCDPLGAEFVISEETARALGLRIGDRIERSLDEIRYAAVTVPLTLVGILEGDPALDAGPSVRVGFVSPAYSAADASSAPPAGDAVVVARPGREDAVNEFLETDVASARIKAETFREVSRYVALGRVMFGVISIIVNCLVAAVTALVVGVINRIALLDRVEELGLLHALGQPKQRLINRLTMETAAVALLGWAAGWAVALLALYGIKTGIYSAIGQELDVWNLLPVWYVLPIPLVVAVFAFGSAWQVFRRLDAVAVVEQGKLSLEGEGAKRRLKRSAADPLSSRTFFARHRLRGLLLGASMALMILGIAFPALLLTSMLGTLSPAFAPLRHFSEVVPAAAGALDPDLERQIRDHPAAAGVFPAQVLGFQVTAPLASGTQVSLYGVAEDDLQALLDLLGMKVVEGRLPRPGDNELVLSSMLARNRGLQVGDAVGGPSPEEGGVESILFTDDIPVELVIVGLLSGDEMWVGFASKEFLEADGLTAGRPQRLLVAPAEGRKNELDGWLTASVASPRVNITTFAASWSVFQQAMQGIAAAFAAVEFLIALVAAVTVAALNHIFLAQRRGEFGVLHALGHGRLWLILRAVKETAVVVGLAWIAGAALCLLALSGLQTLIFTPLGLGMELLNVTPWLFTLPIPLVVVLVGAATVMLAFGRLDPVAVIERRT
jgi:ABC-type lipoprotein release transport system permease subunit